MKTNPRVSICVPNLNTRPYLAERFESIFAQTFSDWELIVVDSYSDDGSWEYIEELAVNEPRMRASQAPKGLYSSWNTCVESARGEYVYIATSDDTMTADCLEKMVAALDANPDCGICQCGLVIIDAESVPYPAERQWDNYTLGRYDQKLISKPNKRPAPHDGIIHPALYTIYTSVTQLLIRRTVFDKVGLFDGRWGAMSDFEWEMRAGLVENCVFIPQKLATWRVHPKQLTAEIHTPKSRLKMIEMVRAAFERAARCDGARLSHIDISDLVYFLDRDIVEMRCSTSRGKIQKSGVLVGELWRRPRATIDFVAERIKGSKRTAWSDQGRHRQLRHVLRKYGVPSPIVGQDNKLRAS